MNAMWRRWWDERGARERLILELGAILIGLTLAYGVLVAPALAGIRRAQLAIPKLQSALAQMQAQAQLAHALSTRASTPALVGERLKEHLQTALAEHGWSAAQTSSTGNGVRIQMNGVVFADWVGFLDDMRQQIRVQVSEMHVTAAPGDVVNVIAVLVPASAG